jgi:hypothetical protein
MRPATDYVVQYLFSYLAFTVPNIYRFPAGANRKWAQQGRLWRGTFGVYFCSKYNEYLFYFPFVACATEKRAFNYGTLHLMYCHFFGKNGLRQDVCEGHRYRRLRTLMNKLAVDT